MAATTSGATIEQTPSTPRGAGRCGPFGGPSGGPFGRMNGGRAQWSGINIAAMVVGFVFFWPAGLAILFWILGGRDVRELPGAVRRQWRAMTGRGEGRERGGRSGNAVFEDFQQTQYDRINEIREEIRERGRRFAEFRATARRRAEQEEFDRFMASAPERP